MNELDERLGGVASLSEEAYAKLEESARRIAAAIATSTEEVIAAIDTLLRAARPARDSMEKLGRSLRRISAELHKVDLDDDEDDEPKPASRQARRERKRDGITSHGLIPRDCMGQARPDRAIPNRNSNLYRRQAR
jgi:hypothetical protein